MPLTKLQLKPGVNRENTRYTNEGGYYESDKVRFRQGTPEKIGGWQRISAATFLGLCRSLWNWVTLGSQNLLGIGTNLKFYIENGGAYYDITPIRTERTLTNPFTTNGTTTVLVTDAAHGAINGDFVTFYGGTAVGGQTIRGEYQITVLTNNTYNITISAAATAATGGGTVYAVYQVNVGPSYAAPLSGWGASTWGSGTWGIGTSSTDALRIWSQVNWGQNLVYGPRGAPMYYWDATIGFRNLEVSLTIASPCVMTSTVALTDGTPITLTTTGALPTGLLPGVTYYVKYLTPTTYNLAATSGGTAINTSGTQSGSQFISPRGMLLSQLPGSDGYCPLYQNTFTISDASRFLLVFGTNDYGSTVLDPLLIRWSDQESLTTWYPAVTNQAGSVRLSHGSKIVTTLQSRQEIVVWTDQALYSLQYLGPPYVWQTQLLADNISIAGPNAAAMASGITYWMGVDKFYKYDGRVQTLRCDLRQYIYSDINPLQFDQIFASTNEGFNEVWFFYCSENSTTIDKYVIYNYLERTWAYGTMNRTAWLDSGLRQYPMAADGVNKRILYHEAAVDDVSGLTPVPIEAYIQSSDFDIGDGHNFGFVWRILPDLTFNGSNVNQPKVTMTVRPRRNSGAPYGTADTPEVASTQNYTSQRTYDVQEFDGQVYTRLRARQMAFRITSTDLGVAWQLGTPRIDIRNDGRR